MKKTAFSLITLALLSTNAMANEKNITHTNQTQISSYNIGYEPTNMYDASEKYSERRNANLDQYLETNAQKRQAQAKTQEERYKGLKSQYSEQEQEVIKRRNQHILEQRGETVFSQGNASEIPEVAYTEEEINNFYLEQNRSPKVSNWSDVLMRVGIAPHITKQKQKTLSKIEFEEWANQMLGLMGEPKTPKIKATVGTIPPQNVKSYKTEANAVKTGSGKVIYTNKKPDASFTIFETK